MATNALPPRDRAARIRWLESNGYLDPACPGCVEFYKHPNLDPFAPSHKPSNHCESGKYPHCTCPKCWG